VSKKRRVAQSSSGRQAKPVQAAAPAASRVVLWIVLSLGALTVAAFSSVRTFGFVRFDDPDYVTQNPHVTAGITWPGVKWALTTGHVANWHPLTWLSHMLDVQLFGVNAGAHHVVNVVLHVVNTVLLFAFFRRVTGATWRSALVAVLFAVHPLHVESVAWVSERKDVLSTFFWLLTMLAYAGYVRTPRASRYSLVIAFLALGLLAKPMVVTLPLVLLLLDVWPLRRITLWRDGRTLLASEDRRAMPRLVLEKLPLLALAAASSIVTILVQRRGGAVGSLIAYPLGLRVENAIVNYAAYLGKTIWPWPLAAFYPYRETIGPLEVLGCAVLIGAISALVVKSSPRRQYLLVGWLWYLGTLVPVIGIVQAGMQSIADRYSYIPLIGPFIMMAWGLAEVVERWPRQRSVLAATLAFAVSALAVVTHVQAATWRDSLTLWQHAVDVTTNNVYAEYNLGVVLIQSGRLDDGITRLRSALRIDPNYSDIHIDLGNALNQKGAVDEALAEFATVVRLRPDYAEARVVYGNLLRARGRVADATTQYREAIRFAPTMGNAHNELGNALTAAGEFAQAMTEYASAVRLAPDLAEAHNNLGAAMLRAGRSNEALGEFLEALRLKPDAPMFHYNAALTLEGAGRAQEAVGHLQTVLKLDPSNDAARRALDRLSSARGPG
jgi:tetratricopeptide (TPR) repeat protein